MKLPKKQAAVVRAALEEWRASGLLDEETGKRLLDDLTPLPFDWYTGSAAMPCGAPLRAYSSAWPPCSATNCSLNSSAAFSS